MKRLLLGIAAMVFFVGTGFASPDWPLKEEVQVITIQTDSGTQIKVHVPKEEQDKLKDVKHGDTVKLVAPGSIIGPDGCEDGPCRLEDN
ncbi:hypothetical protein [Legionella impletisoli]|uniref:Uncharacterized protein n=1 Tax=Legionella impletisoli TaxID=343510 RepID=A0A917K1F3_9GAMM|nr:hypothetical protein [Legionella impletisoli]GGI92649.1 hypothetical protein GCM10007966_21570 [Legionella impletisoli]